VGGAVHTHSLSGHPGSERFLVATADEWRLKRG
jgi:hypothetical protein